MLPWQQQQDTANGAVNDRERNAALLDNKVIQHRLPSNNLRHMYRIQ